MSQWGPRMISKRVELAEWIARTRTDEGRNGLVRSLCCAEIVRIARTRTSTHYCANGEGTGQPGRLELCHIIAPIYAGRAPMRQRAPARFVNIPCRLDHATSLRDRLARRVIALHASPVHGRSRRIRLCGTRWLSFLHWYMHDFRGNYFFAIL